MDDWSFNKITEFVKNFATNIGNLPQELLEKILLSSPSLKHALRLCSTDKRFSDICKQNENRIFKYFIKKDFFRNQHQLQYDMTESNFKKVLFDILNIRNYPKSSNGNVDYKDMYKVLLYGFSIMDMEKKFMQNYIDIDGYDPNVWYSVKMILDLGIDPLIEYIGDRLSDQDDHLIYDILGRGDWIINTKTDNPIRNLIFGIAEDRNLNLVWDSAYYDLGDDIGNSIYKGYLERVKQYAKYTGIFGHFFNMFYKLDKNKIDTLSDQTKKDLLDIYNMYLKYTLDKDNNWESVLSNTTQSI
jgi:hypothetical protein